jgi:hypothetical protein
MIEALPTRDDGVLIGLSAVVMALRDQTLSVLTIRTGDGDDEARGLPFGPFDPARHRTFELALRAFVTAQTGFGLGYVEQLYTFGDAGRDAPRAEMGARTGAETGAERRRVVSVGYLALTPDAGDGAIQVAGAGVEWSPVLDHFPWEDHRAGRPGIIATVIAPALLAWAGDDSVRRSRAEDLFALRPGQRWSEGQVLERYELLYEAGLAAEAVRDRGSGTAPAGLGRPMASDHRRILATGLGRLRSKLKYRPVLFDLTPETFTLSQLQAAAEAVTGLTLHKQNFRRGLERTAMVQPTGRLSTGTGGRPAELFRYRGPEASDAAQGLALPVQT